MVFGLVIADTLTLVYGPGWFGELDFSGHGAALATLLPTRPDGFSVAEVSELIRAVTAELPPAQANAWPSWSVPTAIPPGCFWT